MVAACALMTGHPRSRAVRERPFAGKIWRRWESNPRPRPRVNGFYERSRRSDLVPCSPRRRGCWGPASLSFPGLAKADRTG